MLGEIGERALISPLLLLPFGYVGQLIFTIRTATLARITARLDLDRRPGRFLDTRSRREHCTVYVDDHFQKLARDFTDRKD